jgi:hypothetical protein
VVVKENKNTSRRNFVALFCEVKVVKFLVIDTLSGNTSRVSLLEKTISAPFVRSEEARSKNFMRKQRKYRNL